MKFTSRYERDPKGPLFEARWHGDCSMCGFEIEIGDLAGYVEGDIMCEECWNDS